MALGVLAWSAPAHAATKLKDSFEGKRGVTLWFELDHAPFRRRDSHQAAGGKTDGRYRDPTVIVFVPHHFRAANKRVDVVVHFHGHNTTAAAAMRKHQLREQLYDSKQNAIIVMPQGPVNARDSSAGALETQGGLERLLSEVVGELRRRSVSRLLGKSSLDSVRGVGMVCLSAHSGGYRAAAACLELGGINVNEVYLFDALYGRVRSFEIWVAAAKNSRGRARHKLISHYAGGSVRDNNLKLMRRLRRAGIACLHEDKQGALSRLELTKGRAVFIATRLAHGDVAYGHNGLRDCLFASGLRRRVDTDWFDHKDAPRDIQARS